MITKSQFCHGGSVPDVGDLVEVILAPMLPYFDKGGGGGGRPRANFFGSVRMTHKYRH